MKDILGCKAKDKVTGFSGTIVGHVRYLTGCDQYLIQPDSDKGDSMPDSHWLDENRLDVDTGVQPLALDTSKDKGPCGVAPRY